MRRGIDMRTVSMACAEGCVSARVRMCMGLCTQALAHPYMAELHDPEDEPDCDAEFDFNYEKRDNLTDSNIREMVFQVLSVCACVRVNVRLSLTTQLFMSTSHLQPCMH